MCSECVAVNIRNALALASALALALTLTLTLVLALALALPSVLKINSAKRRFHTRVSMYKYSPPRSVALDEFQTQI